MILESSLNCRDTNKENEPLLSGVLQRPHRNSQVPDSVPWLQVQSNFILLSSLIGLLRPGETRGGPGKSESGIHRGKRARGQLRLDPSSPARDHGKIAPSGCPGDGENQDRRDSRAEVGGRLPNGVAHGVIPEIKVELSLFKSTSDSNLTYHLNDLVSVEAITAAVDKHN